MGCGLFTEEMIEGMQKLFVHPELDAKLLNELIDAIPVGKAERYLTAANTLMKTDHAFKDAATLRKLVNHPALQTMLIEEASGHAFAGLMRSAGGDIARAERRIPALEIFKRRAYAAGGKAAYEDLLAKLAKGEAAAEDALRAARRVDQLAGKLAPDMQNLVLDAIKATDRAGFDAAKKKLMGTLKPMASAEQLDAMDRLVTTAWRIEKLELSSATHGLTRVELAALEDLPIERWNSVLYHGKQRLGWYGKAPEKAVFNFKGLLAEEVFYTSSDYTKVAARARELALKNGLDPGSVRLIRNPRGETLSEITGKLGSGELTDGMIVANGMKNGVTDPDVVHILAVMESKSPSNVGQLAGGKSGAKLPKNVIPEDMLPYEANYFGQMSEDFERMQALSTRVDGKWHHPSQIKVSRKWTEWIAIHPPEHPIPDGIAKRLIGDPDKGLAPLFDKITLTPGIVRDEQLNKIAEALFGVLKL